MTKKMGAKHREDHLRHEKNSAFASLHEECHREKVCRPARTEPACDERLVQRTLAPLAPVACTHAAIIKEKRGQAYWA